MKKKRAIILLVCVLSLPVPSTAEAFDDIFSVMFRMMLTMMNVMSETMLDNSDSFDMGTGNSFDLGMGAWPLMSGMTGMNPMTDFGGMPGMTPWSNPMGGNNWSNPFANSGYGYPVNNNWTQWPGAVNPATANRYPSVSLLDGRWFGNSGEILEIRGNRFRLRNGQSGITGTIRIENNIVSMFSPKTRTVIQYTFLRNQTELLLQDASGRILAFRQ